MKGNLIILVGISGSGKSTWAHEQWEENPNKIKIVNRDKIRELLFGFTENNISEYYSRKDCVKREKEVTRYEDTLIHEGLSADKTVIVDATHLKREYLNRFKYWNVPTVIQTFNVVLEDAIDNDSARERSVGADVIKKQYRKFVPLLNSLSDNPIDFTPVQIDNPHDKPSCFVFDIDGTLAHMEGRSPYEWKRVIEDKIDYAVALMAKMVELHKFTLIICTGRDGVCLPETEEWLSKVAHLDYDVILCRNVGDMRPDWVVKQEMWEAIVKDYHVAAMFDDRLQVVRRARALGFKVFNVEYNNF